MISWARRAAQAALRAALPNVLPTIQLHLVHQVEEGAVVGIGDASFLGLATWGIGPESAMPANPIGVIGAIGGSVGSVRFVNPD
jgi:hypothetical protein